MTTAPHADRPVAGMALAALAVAFLAVQSLAAKLLALGGVPAPEAVFWRCALAVVPLAIWIQVRGRWGEVFSVTRPWTLAWRTVVGNAGLWLIFGAFALLPLAQATVLMFTSVLMAPLLAIAFLGERVGPHRWAAIGAGFVGVVIAVGPGWAVAPLGVALALAGAASNAGVKTFLRALKGESSLALTFWFLAGGVVLSAPVALALSGGAFAATWAQAPLLLALGGAGLFLQLFMAMAFRRAPTSLVAPWDYTGLLWAAVFDVLIWHIVPGWPVFAGAAVIAASHLYLLHRERRRA
jgi:drug/metabolite transporter (DMT)-like permease